MKMGHICGSCYSEAGARLLDLFPGNQAAILLERIGVDMRNDSPEWHYSIDGQPTGPVSAEGLKALARSGKLRPSDLVWKSGMQNWVSASKIRGLFPTPMSSGSETAALPSPLQSAAQVALPRGRKPPALSAWTLMTWVPMLLLTAVAARHPGAAGGVFVLTALTLLATAIWAAMDSARLSFRRYKSFLALRPWAVALCVLLLWSAVFPLYLCERSRLKAGLIPAADGDAAASRLSRSRVLTLLGMALAYFCLSKVIASASVYAKPLASTGSSDGRLPEPRVSASGEWTKSIVRASLSDCGMSDADKIGLVASMPQSAECSAKFFAALVLIQASNSARGQDFAKSQELLHENVGQGCSLAKAGDAMLQATEYIRESQLSNAAAELQRCVQLLRAADRESATRQVEDPQMEAVAPSSLGIGCYQVCELYVMAGFAPELAQASCSAFELMEELISTGSIEADSDLYGMSSRAAAAAYAGRIGSGNGARDAEAAARARSALQVKWEPGNSLPTASLLLAEALAWARLDNAVSARTAFNQAIAILESSGRDVAELRAIAAKGDREFLELLKE